MAARLEAEPTAIKVSPPREPSVSSPARVAVMGGLLIAALVDYTCTRTGLVNHSPGGNPTYAVTAGALTVALWGLLPGYTAAGRRATRLQRAAMYAALLALHAAAVVVAYAPRHNPAATAVMDGAGSTLVVAVMTFVAGYAWWCRITTRGGS